MRRMLMIVAFALGTCCASGAQSDVNSLSRRGTKTRAGEKAGEFCEIFQQDRDTQDTSVRPVFILDVGTEKVLGTDDLADGSGGQHSEDYWTFDKDGPIWLDYRIVGQAARRLLPSGKGLDIRRSHFDIRTLIYLASVSQPGDLLHSPSGGTVEIRFAFRGHHLAVVRQLYAPHWIEEPDNPAIF